MEAAVKLREYEEEQLRKEARRVEERKEKEMQAEAAEKDAALARQKAEEEKKEKEKEKKRRARYSPKAREQLFNHMRVYKTVI